MYKQICKNCGEEFESDRERTYCCMDCYKTYISTHIIHKEKNEKVEVICANCGKHEMVTVGRSKHYKTCSKQCLAEYHSKLYSKKIKVTCAICGKEFECKPSEARRRKTCSKQCLAEYKSLHCINDNNPNSRLLKINKGLVKKTAVNKYGDLHKAIVKNYFHLRYLPKGYHIHHKDADNTNNELTNLVLLPQDIHMLIHRIFGNVLINALHTNRITREVFYEICDENQKKFYEQIIDLNITNQAVVKQGELLENLEVDDQQPSIYRNVYEGSTTNNRVLTEKSEDSNVDTSALPLMIR